MYSFAFNYYLQKIDILTYTDEEYKEHLQSLNDGMTESCDPLVGRGVCKVGINHELSWIVGVKYPFIHWYAVI